MKLNIFQVQQPQPTTPTPPRCSLGHVILEISKKPLSFKPAMANSPDTRAQYWSDQAHIALSPHLNNTTSTQQVTHDHEDKSLSRYGLPDSAYRTWCQHVQIPAIEAIHNGTPVSRHQLNDYFAQARATLAEQAAKFTADSKKLSLGVTKAHIKSHYFGQLRKENLFTPLGSNTRYESYSHRAIKLIKENAQHPVFKKTRHLTIHNDTLRMTQSRMYQDRNVDTLALVYSIPVGRLRIRTTETHLSANSLKLQGIETPQGLDSNWNKDFPETFWLHSKARNIPYLETLSNQCYESILDETHLPVNLINKILHLHFLESHLCKFSRGSAAINHWKTQSLLTAFGGGEIDLPSDLDCIALSHNQFGEFLEEVQRKCPELSLLTTRLRQPETLSMQMCNAIKNSDHHALEPLLNQLTQHELPQVRSPSGLTLMQLAAKYNNSRLIEQLIQHSVPANHNEDGRTPLMLAAQNGAIQSMHRLVDYLRPNEIEPLESGKNHPLHYLVISNLADQELVLVANTLCMKLARNNQNLNRSDCRGQSAARTAKQLNRHLLKEVIETHAEKFPMMESSNNP